ncbi:MAG: DEAD/DEAH box helicase [Planctomycetaceae bacterium]
MYLDQLPYDPYPVQEEALLTWFSDDHGVLLCAPTGTGKTVVAEAALFEALHTGKTAYYTTPLIALTEQKFQEMREAAIRWGFDENEIGLVTGNRSVNPHAKVLVVVAEILLNRLLNADQFDFSNVAAVVMDEFHSFSDAERGVVWELSLGLLPKHVRLLLLSATVGNSAEFIMWLRNQHQRKVQLIQSTDRKVPLSFQWVGDQLLSEQIEEMSQGDGDSRRTPALIFCFNREQCWSVAEHLKGKHLLDAETKKRLAEEINRHDWSHGAGPKLKTILLRGVGVHHAGMLPRYRRLVESLFQRKLLSIATCTETLAAGINLPARSVLLTSLLKGPPGKKRLIDASSAHQIFGRAGRPQFDDRGFVYALAHEDDVKILRWKEKYDQIPEDTKDPQLIKAKKRMKKKAPTRRKTEQYWNETQFQKLIEAPPGKLESKGPLPWRLLAYMLQISPDVERLQRFANKRLMNEKRLRNSQREITHMLVTLEAGGYVKLTPPPPREDEKEETKNESSESASAKPKSGTIGALLQEAVDKSRASDKKRASQIATQAKPEPEHNEYQPKQATPDDSINRLLIFRSVNPLYGDFLIRHFDIADFNERIQALESVLDLPGSVAKLVRIPRFEELPPGPLATTRLDQELVQRGLVTTEQLTPREYEPGMTWEERWTPTLAEKLRLLFDAEYPGVHSLRTRPVWIAGELLQQGGDFNKYVTSNRLAKQEGIIFRHLLRLILLCGEFAQLCPPGFEPEDWQAELNEIAGRLTESCRKVDPESTEKTMESAANRADVVQGIPGAESSGGIVAQGRTTTEDEEEFGLGVMDSSAGE